MLRHTHKKVCCSGLGWTALELVFTVVQSITAIQLLRAAKAGDPKAVEVARLHICWRAFSAVSPTSFQGRLTMKNSPPTCKAFHLLAAQTGREDPLSLHPAWGILERCSAHALHISMSPVICAGVRSVRHRPGSSPYRGNLSRNAATIYMLRSLFGAISPWMVLGTLTVHSAINWSTVACLRMHGPVVADSWMILDSSLLQQQVHGVKMLDWKLLRKLACASCPQHSCLQHLECGIPLLFDLQPSGSCGGS